MIALLARLFRRKPVKPDLAVIIARRALRLGNRSAAAAAKYEQVQMILAQGRK